MVRLVRPFPTMVPKSSRERDANIHCPWADHLAGVPCAGGDRNLSPQNRTPEAALRSLVEKLWSEDHLRAKA
jgi:hypothetical protein